MHGINSCHEQPTVGFEPTTPGLQNQSSTVELRWRLASAGAGLPPYSPDSLANILETGEIIKFIVQPADGIEPSGAQAMRVLRPEPAERVGRELFDAGSDGWNNENIIASNRYKIVYCSPWMGPRMQPERLVGARLTNLVSEHRT